MLVETLVSGSKVYCTVKGSPGWRKGGSGPNGVTIRVITPANVTVIGTAETGDAATSINRLTARKGATT